MSRETIRKAARDGRLQRCNSDGDTRAEFSVEEVDRYIASLDRERALARAQPLALARTTPPSLEIAKADAVVSMTGQAMDHTEHAWEAARKMLDTVRRDYENILASKERELERLTRRVEHLEGQQEEYRKAMDVLRESQFKQTIAEAQADRIRAGGAAAVEVGKLVAPAVIARVFGGEALTRIAFTKFVNSMDKEQRDKIFATLGPLLTPDQLGVLMALMAEWDEGSSTSEARNDTERPPAPAENAA